MENQIRYDIDDYLQNILQSKVFDMEISVAYTNRSITASYEVQYNDEDETPPPTFAKKILAYIEHSPHSSQDLCRRAKVDYKVISRSKANQHYRPSKSIVLSLGMALGLSKPLMKAFLVSANYDFTQTKRDLIIQYFIDHSIYDLEEINTYLTHYKELLLGSV